ncbi:MAG: signal peptidase I [Bacilli bacterium]|jgi:signal peptidase I
MIDFIEFLKDIFGYAIIIALIILIRIFVLVPIEVVGTSMEPNLKNGDIILMDKVAYNYFKLKRFDVIVSEYDSPKHIVKRIIGLPGDKIRYIDNKLYINEKEVEEKFNKYGVIEDYSLKELDYEKIPEDMYFVIGDNREDSVDSRSFGLIHKEEIEGKPFLVIWPLNHFKLVK